MQQESLTQHLLYTPSVIVKENNYPDLFLSVKLLWYCAVHQSDN